MADAIPDRVNRYILDSGDDDLRRLLRSAPCLLESWYPRGLAGARVRLRTDWRSCCFGGAGRAWRERHRGRPERAGGSVGEIGRRGAGTRQRAGHRQQRAQRRCRDTGRSIRPGVHAAS